MNDVVLDDCYEEISKVINKYNLNQYELFGILESLKVEVILNTKYKGGFE